MIIDAMNLQIGNGISIQFVISVEYDVRGQAKIYIARLHTVLDEEEE